MYINLYLLFLNYFSLIVHLKQYLKKFNVGINGRIITDGATISDIAANTSTPVLVMTCQDNGTGTPMI